MRNRTRLVVAAAALLGAVACGASPSAPRVAGGASQPAAAVSPTALTPAQRTHAWLAYAACLRAHGTSVADPTFDQDGNPQFSTNLKDDTPQAARQACQSLLQGVSTGKLPPPTATELAQLTRFAQCMRQHGVPDWPDPDPQSGAFRTANPDFKSIPGYRQADQACHTLLPPKPR